MTPGSIRLRITVIEAECYERVGGGRIWDDETAHVREDELRAEVLRAIADDDCDDPAGCARAALKTEALDFSRWYS